jgi:hypothetical protein
MKNWIKRAIRTFFQTAVGYITVAIPTVDWNDSALKTTLIGIGMSALAAGISAVMNYIDDKKLY